MSCLVEISFCFLPVRHRSAFFLLPDHIRCMIIVHYTFPLLVKPAWLVIFLLLSSR